MHWLVHTFACPFTANVPWHTRRVANFWRRWWRFTFYWLNTFASMFAAYERRVTRRIATKASFKDVITFFKVNYVLNNGED